MIDERVRHWKELASADMAIDRSRAKSGGSGNLGVPTFSQRYFELLGMINNLQASLWDAIDVIQKQDKQIQYLSKKNKNER